jgi:signal transduction histidine kinase
MALVMTPIFYAIFRLRNQPFNLAAAAVVVPVAVLLGVASTALLRRYRARLIAHERWLERFLLASFGLDVVFFGIGVYYAGERGLWSRPFICIPVILAATLLPDMFTFGALSCLAVTVTLLATHPSGAYEILARLLLCFSLLAVGAFIAFAMLRIQRRHRGERAELERMRRDKMLAEAVSRRREEILSAVSHELASPLTTLRGYIRLLRESKGRDRGSSHLIDRLDRQADRLASLAGDLRAMAGTADESTRLIGSNFDLVDMLREIVGSARAQHPEAEVRLLGEERVFGAWDRERLDQVFGNLVTNAFQFAGAKAHVTIDVARTNEHAVQISVFDDGPTIAPAALARVFEPFQRYSAERGGLGLGLATARAAVEAHGGRIWAESSGERGAAFHVSLPVDELVEDVSAPGAPLDQAMAARSPA